MAEKKSKSFFWASYADLMTSLFFVMLMLFVVAVVELNNKNEELTTTNTTIQIEKGKLEAQLKKAQVIKVSIQNTSNILVSIRSINSRLMLISLQESQTLNSMSRNQQNNSCLLLA